MNEILCSLNKMNLICLKCGIKSDQRRQYELNEMKSFFHNIHVHRFYPKSIVFLIL